MLQTDHSTEVNQILEAVEQSLLPRRLSSIEKFVLHQSWLGQTYNEMAQSSGYASDYIKEVGSQLWQDISDTVGQRVTKKNLHLVLNQIQTNFIGRQKKEAEPELEIIDKKHESEDVQLLTINKEIPYPNAPLDLTSPFYINRPPVEEIAYQEISQPGCAIGIRAPRKMGKRLSTTPHCFILKSFRVQHSLFGLSRSRRIHLYFSRKIFTMVLR